MVDYHERQRLIRESLKIRPVNHGQVHTCLVGMRSRPEIAPDRYEELRWSLTNHNSNLIPIVVRRTDRFDDEIEYEVIHGADWVIVASDIGIEMLWAWVFDLNDEEVAAARDELALLLEAPPTADRPPIPTSPAAGASTEPQFSLADLGQLLDDKLNRALDQKLANLTIPSTHAALETRIEDLAQRVETLSQQPPTVSNGDSGAIGAAHEMVASLERSISRVCEVVSQGSKITLTIEPPPKPIAPAEAELRKLYTLLAAAKLKTLAKERGIAVSAKAKPEEIIDALLDWHRQQS